MKYLLALLFVTPVFADHTIDVKNTFCSFDIQGAVLEFGNCMATIDLRDTGAFGAVVATLNYDEKDLTAPRNIPRDWPGLKLRGTGVVEGLYNKHIETLASCVMVASDQTVYTTDDWNLEIKWRGQNSVMLEKLVYRLDCRSGM